MKNNTTIYSLIAIGSLIICGMMLIISVLVAQQHAMQINYFKQGLANEQQRSADLQQQLIDAEHMIAELEYTKYR